MEIRVADLVNNTVFIIIQFTEIQYCKTSRTLNILYIFIKMYHIFTSRFYHKFMKLRSLATSKFNLI